jgi:hypothetical protein
MEEVISSFKNRQVIEYSDESIITAFIALCTKDREVNYDSSYGDTSYPWDFDGDPTRYNGLLDTLAENYNLDSKEDNLDNLCF